MCGGSVHLPLTLYYSPYVVKYYGSYFKNTDLWVSPLTLYTLVACDTLTPLSQIVMEYCGAGSVSDIMRIIPRPVCSIPVLSYCHTVILSYLMQLKEEEIAVILYYALKGLEYLHFKRKIHRDIKAGNILLNLEGQAKLGEGVPGGLGRCVMCKLCFVIFHS